ncbi:MAG TPA: hypothetical protein VES97_07525 [Solirubrobacteraceae bacterium]|nr:hypothetical protein [Solirubrobacteraceae bacterium]
MHTESSGSRAAGDPRLERAIVLQLLRDDREQRWSRRRLGAEIDAEAPAMEEALRRLCAEGVLCAAEGQVWASRAARRLDELGLIGI